jgi:tetratricopeptide (TPR) repeat protein
MKRAVAVFFIAALVAVSCVSVDPAMEDGNASLNWGKQLMNDGKIALAIVEFKKALAFFDEGGYSYSAFGVYPYIARGYYLSGNAEEAIATYFEALGYAKQHEDAVADNDCADVMRELAGLLVEARRFEEARNILMDAAYLYKRSGNEKAFQEVTRELDGL